MKLPSIAEPTITASAGMVYFDSTDSEFKYYDGSAWASFGGGASITANNNEVVFKDSTGAFVGDSKFTYDGTKIKNDNYIDFDSTYAVAIGLNAKSVSTGNTSIGSSAGYSNSTSASYNTFIGFRAGYKGGQFGGQNVSIGHDTLYSCGANISKNVIIGDTSAYQVATLTSDNVFIGHGVIYSNTSQVDSSVFIGKDSGNATTSAITKAVVIGFECGKTYASSNRLMIDVSDTDTPLIDGDFTNRVLTINEVLKLQPSSAPSSASIGMIYFDSTANKLKVYTGSAWETISSS